MFLENNSISCVIIVLLWYECYFNIIIDWFRTNSIIWTITWLSWGETKDGTFQSYVLDIMISSCRNLDSQKLWMIEKKSQRPKNIRILHRCKRYRHSEFWLCIPFGVWRQNEKLFVSDKEQNNIIKLTPPYTFFFSSSQRHYLKKSLHLTM